MRRATSFRYLVGFIVFSPMAAASAARAETPAPDSTPPPDVVVEAGPRPADSRVSAPASPPPSVFVHVDSPSSVELQRKHDARDSDDAFETLCTSPCDTYVPAEGEYRIGHTDEGDLRPAGPSADIRPSSAFSLPEGRARDAIAVEPATRGGFVGGIVLTAVGGVAIDVAALWALAGAVASFDGGDSPNMTGPLVTALGGVGLVAGGVTLIVRNVHSRVALTGEKSAIVPPPSADIEWPGGRSGHDGLERAVPRRGLGLPLLELRF